MIRPTIGYQTVRIRHLKVSNTHFDKFVIQIKKKYCDELLSESGHSLKSCQKLVVNYLKIVNGGERVEKWSM